MSPAFAELFASCRLAMLWAIIDMIADHSPPHQIHTKIPLHANPTPSHLPPDPNSPLERTNDAIHERRHLPPRVHEPTNEPARSTTNSNGVRKRERCDGSAAGDDG